MITDAGYRRFLPVREVDDPDLLDRVARERGFKDYAAWQRAVNRAPRLTREIVWPAGQEPKWDHKPPRPHSRNEQVVW